MPAPEVTINISRLMGELDRLAQYSDAPAPAVTRVLYSPTDVAARAYIKELFEAAGLRIREDGVGNIFARWEGSEPALSPVATGSHIDAIPYSGRYDGTVGVLGSLEAIRTLAETGFRPRRTIDLIVFTAEEPTRFGIGCLGSRALAGSLSPAQLMALKDSDGNDFESLCRGAGYTGDLQAVALPEGCYAAFVELHIEQGVRLEQAGIPIGVVDAIAAPAALTASIEGDGGHAGAVLMPERADALLAGAELALAVERAALDTGSPNAVGTVGVFSVYPGASNSIPSQVTLSIDLRDTDQAIRDGMIDTIKVAADEVSGCRRVRIRIDTLNADPPAASHPKIVSAIEEASAHIGLRSQRLVSRAYHDALFMGILCPTAMIFVPSKDGYSHRPEEYTAPEEIARGVHVLALVLAELSSQPE